MVIVLAILDVEPLRVGAIASQARAAAQDGGTEANGGEERGPT